MAASRLYEYNVAVTTPTQPVAGSPSLASDLITLSYLQANYAQVPVVSGTLAAPQSCAVGDSIAHNLTSSKFFGMCFVDGDGGAINLTSNPQVAVPTAIGQELTIVGTDDTNTLQLDNGDGLELNGPCILGAKSMITLKALSLTTWTEKSRQ